MKPSTSTTIKCRLLVFIITLVLPVAVQASNWWNDEWPFRKQVTLDATASGVVIAEPIGTAPVLIRLHAGNFRFDAAREDGSDLRFVSEDNKTLLPYHIDKYDALMGEAFVWVKVPELKPGSKTAFWLYFGNASPKVEKGSDAKATYDEETVLVFHFNENGTPAIDSTGYANISQNAGLSASGAFIGNGIRFDEQTNLIVPSSPSLQWQEGSPVTISTWIKLNGTPPNDVYFSRREGSTNAVVVGVDNGSPYIEIIRNGSAQRSPQATPIPAGNWRQLAVVASSETITLYLNGETVAELKASLPAMNAPIQIGGEKFTGELDEFVISKVARPLGFIKLAALGQGEAGTKLLVFGADEQTTSWFTGGYLGVIVKSLTMDGWIVIGILAVMALISWWVMGSKGVYLSQVDKGNARFMKAWHAISTNLTILIHSDIDQVQTLGGQIDQKSFRSIRNSSIYRIYRIGAEELRGRLEKKDKTGFTKTLSAQSVQAIRATLDGGLVRETQKLNRLLVLLTIAISGGPFLGLLGTVVGVMITFAAIAQEGEVNVNSIAPGISAALAATVAGLAVAIPALFGYNYLLSRVKDATSDMHVFIDEFVTKLAESFSGSEEATDETITEILTKN
jgi:biopolymer transport protein ExbB